MKSDRTSGVDFPALDVSRPWWASAASGTPAPMVGRYALKRLLRIWPVYLVTVVVAFAVVPGNEDAGAREWLASALLLDTYVDDTLPYGLTQMWSLSVEVALAGGALMMAGVYLTSFFTGITSGWLARFYEPWGATTFFIVHAGIALAGGALFFVLGPLVRRKLDALAAPQGDA